MKNYRVAAVAAIILVGILPAFSVEGNEEVLVWQAGVDGIEIEWRPDGSLNRLFSRHSQPVTFPDRRGIATAQIIAEEKAKAAIIRFFDQAVVTGRLVAEVSQDLESATRTTRSRSDDWIRENKRQFTQSLTEFTSSVSAGTLRGVVTLERGYDEGREEAWVVVGLSERSIRAASSAADFINNPSPPAASTDQNLSPGAENRILQQPSEVRRGNPRF